VGSFLWWGEGFATFARKAATFSDMISKRRTTMIDPTLYVERLLEIDQHDPHRGEWDNPLDEKRRDIIHEYLAEYRKQNPPLSVEQMSPLQKAQYQLIAIEVQKILDGWLRGRERGFNESKLDEGFINISHIAVTLSSLFEKEGCRKILWSFEENNKLLNQYNSYYSKEEESVLGCLSIPRYTITVEPYFEELDRNIKYWEEILEKKSESNPKEYARKELLDASEKMSMGKERLENGEFVYYVFYEGYYLASEFANGNTNLYKWNGSALEYVKCISSWIS
jgi:hypothetical protein